MESAKETAGKAHDKAHEAAGHSQEHAQRSKDENAGFLQQVLNYSLIPFLPLHQLNLGNYLFRARKMI